jgi:hypothetical protein
MFARVLTAGLALGLAASGCSSIEREKAQLLAAEWAAPGALGAPGASGVRLYAASIIGNDADASWLGFALGMGGEGNTQAFSAGVHGGIGLEMLTLLMGKTPPGWSRYVSPVLGVGFGVLYGGAEDTGLGAYIEGEAGISIEPVDGVLVVCGWRGVAYAAEESGGGDGWYARLGFTF